MKTSFVIAKYVSDGIGSRRRVCICSNSPFALTLQESLQSPVFFLELPNHIIEGVHSSSFLCEQVTEENLSS